MNVSCVPMSNLYVCIQSKHNNDELGIADGIKTTTNVDIRKMVKADSARKSGMKFVQIFQKWSRGNKGNASCFAMLFFMIN